MRRGLVWTMLVLLAITGCGGDGLPSNATPWSPPATPTSQDETWPVRVETGVGGELTAPGFNSFVDSAAPSWAESPASAAAELLHMGRWDGPIEARMAVEETRGDGARVTVVLTRLGDDSIAARRYRVMLKPSDDGLYRFVSGQWSQRCQPGRGHQRFAARKCA